MPADEIGLLPDQNDAEVVQREPGVLMEKNEARRRPYRAYSWRGAESEQRDTERTADGIDGDRPRLRARRAAGFFSREHRTREGGDTRRGCEHDLAGTVVLCTLTAFNRSSRSFFEIVEQLEINRQIPFGDK